MPSGNSFPPLLDEAMGQLRDQDRNALVLRFFQNKSLRDVGSALGVDEYAAQKRVGRALERLRAILAKRGAVATTVADCRCDFRQLGQGRALPCWRRPPPPPRLAKGASAGGSALTLFNTAIKLMAWTKMKTAAIVGAVALLGVVTTTVVVRHCSVTSVTANIERAKRGIPTDPSALAQAEATSKILIFRNIRSCGIVARISRRVLKSMHFKYDVKPSSRYEEHRFGGLRHGHHPLGAQWRTGFYRDYAENKPIFDTFVSNGGTLVCELNGAEQEGITLPDGVHMVLHPAGQWPGDTRASDSIADG